MFCKFCGKETTGKFLYCPFCGKNQNEEVYEDAKSSRQEQGQNDGFNRVNENSNQCKNTGEYQAPYTFINTSDPPTAIQKAYVFIYNLSEHVTGVLVLITAICFIIAIFGGFDAFFDEWGGFGR